MTATSEGRPARAAEPRRAAGWAGWSKPWRGVFALLLALVVGFGGWSTWAYWSDQAALTTGSFTSGELDLRLDGTNANGLGTGYTKTGMALANMLPGESQAYPLIINNDGNPTAISYTMRVIGGPTWTFTSGAIQLRVFAGASLSNSPGPSRTGTCAGTALGSATPVPLPSGTAAELLSSSRALPRETSETVCLLVTMPTTVDNANQGKTGTMTITVTANQAT